MAEKRMFSIKVTESDAFTEMGASAQALYFHLNQGADDDGFNNQINTAMFRSHASVDDLKVLLAKNFIIRFESGVIVIKHWRLHNTLRKDRYNPTNYQEEMAKLGIKENGVYTEMATVGCQVVANGLPDGYHSIDKYSIDKNIDIDKSISCKNATCPYLEIVNLFNNTCVKLPKVSKITEARKTAIRNRWNDEAEHNTDIFKKVFETVNNNAFLSGDKSNWKASFDWLMKPSNFIKVLEGVYDDGTSSSEKTLEDILRERRGG